MNFIRFIIAVGVILMIIEAIVSLFKKQKENKAKKIEINSKIKNAFETHEKNIDELQQKYNNLYSEFMDYKKEAEKSLSEMGEYTDKIITISDKIITYDDDFEKKLYLWCDLLNNPNNSENVRKQIKEHLDRDIKLRDEINLEQKQKEIQHYRNLRRNFDLEMDR